MRKSTKFLSALAVAGMISASGSAFTASNTMATTDAGSGTVAISPYATSDVQYTANASDPQNLDAVRFTLDKTARYVALRTKAGTVWYKSNDARLGTTASPVNSCTTPATGQTGAGTVWTCDVTGTSETVAAADNLTIVATR